MADPVTPSDLPSTTPPLDAMKASGYSDPEINDYLAPKIAAARAAGYSQDEINAYMGVQAPPPFNGDAVRDHGLRSLAAASAVPAEGGAAKPVTSFEDALEAGWQLSTAGLQVRGKVPNKQVAADAPMYSRIAGQVAQTVGDIPAMVAGFGVGAAGGVEGGPVGMAVGGSAGAFAFPTALRGLMMDAYSKGQFANPKDFWGRIAPIMIDTAKSWVTGAATGGAGAAVEFGAPAVAGAIPAMASPAVVAATKTAAEVATMTTVGKALEGQLPSARDFVDAAITVGGLKFAEVGAGKLRNIYAKTGIPPAAVMADAAKDITVQQDLMSDREMPALYEKPQEPSAAAASAEQPIAPADLTPEQITALPDDKLAEHLSAASEAHDTAFQEAEQKAADWIAHHGTPHDFEKFDISKIGTGEGAQAFGHGLYFAENPDIARSYRDKLTEKDFIETVKDIYSEGDSLEDAEADLMHSDEVSPAQKELLLALKADDWLGFDYPHQAVQAALRNRGEFELSPETEAALKKFGNLYTVRINAKPEEMLDWDAKGGNQPPLVRAALSKVGFSDSEISFMGSGGNAYAELSDRLGGDEAASKALLAAGVKGIRYADAGNRAALANRDRDISSLQSRIHELDGFNNELREEIDRNRDNPGLLPRFFERRQEDIARNEKEIAEHQQRIEDLKAEKDITRNIVAFHHDDVEITHKNGEPVEPHAPTDEEIKELEDESEAVAGAGAARSEDVEPGQLTTGDQGGVPGSGEAGGGGLVPPGGAGPPSTERAGQPPERPLTPDEARKEILGHISVGDRAQTRPWTWSRLYTDVFNRLFPIEQAVTHTVGADNLPVAEDAGKLARLLSGSPGLANRFLQYNTLDFETRQPNGEGLQTILAPIKDDLDGFRAYAASQRALELASRGIETGFNLDAARTLAESGRARYGDTFQRLVDYQNRVTDYLRDAGVLSEAGVEAMREVNKLYVPFQRVMDQTRGNVAQRIGASLQPTNPVHGIQGSERVVIDPLESVIRNTYLYTQMAERNVVATKLINMLNSAAEAEAERLTPPPETALTVPGAPPVLTFTPIEPGSLEDLSHLFTGSGLIKEDEIRMFEDGQPVTYRVDPELAMAMKSLDETSMGMLERIMAPFARTLRAGAVLQPDFVARHTIRDFLYATVTHPGMFNPLDLIRGFMSLAKHDQEYQEWLSSGGANVSMVSLDRRYLQTSIDRLAGTGILERAWNVVDNPNATAFKKTKAVAGVPVDAARRYLLNPMQMAVEFAESATHIGAFIKARDEMLAGQPEGTPLTKEQTLEAGFASRDVAVDAARMGAKIRTYNAIKAFANIALQDTDRIARAFIKSPMSTSIKVAAAISLPSALVWYNGHDDPRYEDAPIWQRDLFWVIPTDKWEPTEPKNVIGVDKRLVRFDTNGKPEINNGIVFRIPKPWGMGLVFGSGLERGLDAFFANRPDATKDFLKSMGEVSIPVGAPDFAVPIIEQFANRSMFMNRTLVPSEMEKYLPEYQYTPYTTETTKALGQLLGAFPGISAEKTAQGAVGGVARAITSPILLENYLRAWTGNLGAYTLQLADKGLRASGALPDPVQPAKTLADIPFVRAFVVRYPSASVQSIQDFNDAFDENKTYWDTWVAKAKTGDVEALARIQSMSTPIARQGMTDLNATLYHAGINPPDTDKAAPALRAPRMRSALDTQALVDLAGVRAQVAEARAAGPITLDQMSEIRSIMTEHSQLIRDVYANKDMPSDEKRQLIDTVYYRMQELATIGMEGVRRADEAFSGASPLGTPTPVANENTATPVPAARAPTATFDFIRQK